MSSTYLTLTRSIKGRKVEEVYSSACWETYLLGPRTLCWSVWDLFRSHLAALQSNSARSEVYSPRPVSKAAALVAAVLRKRSALVVLEEGPRMEERSGRRKKKKAMWAKEEIRGLCALHCSGPDGAALINHLLEAGPSVRRWTSGMIKSLFHLVRRPVSWTKENEP